VAFFFLFMNEILQRYHSGVSEKIKADSEAAAPLRFLALEFTHPSSHTFSINYTTDIYGPNHVVTLRTEIDGWGRDIYGVYENGSWKYFLPKDEYGKSFEFKFFLDGTNWMTGTNLVKNEDSDLNYSDAQVKFDPVNPRHPLPFDRLRVREDAAQQILVRNCYREDYEFDVIVIGSGMGGGILADALTDREKGVETLVLDIGCLDFATHVYNLPGTDLGEIVNRHQVGHWSEEAGATMYFTQSVQMNLGGRSVFWSGVIPQMRKWELTHWPDDIANYLLGGGYAKAETLMHKHVTFGEFQKKLIAAIKKDFEADFDIVNTPRAYHQPEFAAQGSPPDSFILQSTGTFSTAELLLDSLTNNGQGGSEHLYVNLNHFVTEVRCIEGHIVEVICQDLVGNKRRTYRAKQYVLAAGSMESVRIALESKLEKEHPLIGKGFTDHPSYFVGYDEKHIYLNADSPWAGPHNHARIFFYPKQPYKDALFNVEIVLNTEYWRERHTDNDIQESRLNSQRTGINFKFNFDRPLNESNFVALGGARGKLRTRVDLIPENLVWKEAVKDLTKKLLKFFGAPDVDFDKFGGWGNGGTPHHAGGSMRMGTSNDASKCVVDTNLRFLKIDNLYACDVSVFPHIPAANPSLTLAALALRLADHLAKKIGK
jgi:choline dehydrogenase-like flavoprotein